MLIRVTDAARRACDLPGVVGGAVFLLAMALVAAGCHHAAAPVASDGSVAPGGGDAADLGGDVAPDLATGGAPDLATADLASGPPDLGPLTFVAGDFRTFEGATVDGWAAVIDGAGTAWAINLRDGGTLRRIADHAKLVWPAGDALFAEHDDVNGTGALELWRKNGPAIHLADQAPLALFGLANPLSDGAGHIAYYTGNNLGAALVVDTIDHTAPRVVLQGIVAGPTNTACVPKVRFFAGRLLAQHCAGGATSNKTRLSSYAVTGTADVELASDAKDYAAAVGFGVLVASTSDALTLVAADGSGSATALAADVREVHATDDGSAAVLVTRSGGLERLALADHAITPLQPDGTIAHVLHLSHDGAFATYYHAFDQVTSLFDVWLSDTRTAHPTAVALDAAMTSYRFGDDFTADSRFVFYLVDVDHNTGLGSMRARSVAGGDERILGAGSDFAWPIGKSRVVFVENKGGTYPDLRADLTFVDLGSAAPPTKIATQAYFDCQVLSDGVTLLYVQPGAGLHIATLP